MTSAFSKHFIIGLPEAGKTTFLAALWHVLESREVEGAMVLDSFHGDQGYLHDITALWADSNELDRTKIPHEKYVSMRLRESTDNVTTEVVFPDLSGESFRIQWRDREMDIKYAELLDQAHGGLMLVHPLKVVSETLIADVNPVINRLAASETTSAGEAPDTEAHDESRDEAQWDADKSPTQVQLVDLAQFAVERCAERHDKIKIGLIVSAWDCINGPVRPSEWVRENLPLLWQYLTANDGIDVEYFGISAQGGKLEDADELREVVRKSGRCSDRIRVVLDDLSESHDITTPVRWVMGVQ